MMIIADFDSFRNVSKYNSYIINRKAIAYLKDELVNKIDSFFDNQKDTNTRSAASFQHCTGGRTESHFI